MSITHPTTPGSTPPAVPPVLGSGAPTEGSGTPVGVSPAATSLAGDAPGGSVVIPMPARQRHLTASFETDESIALRNGDRMSREEFHRRYERQPEGVRFQLIGGIVYMASPIGLPHAEFQSLIATIFGLYQFSTTGTKAASTPSIKLGPDSEPEPDVLLRILPNHGGRSGQDHLYIVGPPELVAEIAYSTHAIDLHSKKDDYRRYGVLEYLVVNLADQTVRWFNMTDDRELAPDAAGVVRSGVFPGLWLDVPALFRQDTAALMAALNAGLASPEHRDFAAALAARVQPPTQ